MSNINIDEMTPSEIALTREIEILKSKLAYYNDNEFRPSYLSEDPPSTITMTNLEIPLKLALKARVQPDRKSGVLLGYHVFAIDVRSGFTIDYYVSDTDLNTNRYRVSQYLNDMMRDVTKALADAVTRGDA